MAKFTIYHNPRCSKSRQTLQLLEENGVTPDVVEYLQNPPSEEQLKMILKALKLSPRQLMRTKEEDYKAQGMDSGALSDDQLIALMVQFPKVIERPIVVSGKKVAVGRPPENILAIL